MTDANVRALIRRWLPRLGLVAWRVEFQSAVPPEDESSEASVSFKWDYDEATLRLQQGWRSWDERKLEETVVHELLHLTLRDIEHAVVRVVQAEGEGHRAFDHAYEGAIDRLSRLIVALAA